MIISKDELIQLYVEEGKSANEIGKMKFCSHTTVFRYLNEYGIETRSIREGIKQKYDLKPEKIKKLLKKHNQSEIAKMYGCNPATVSIAIKRFKEDGKW